VSGLKQLSGRDVLRALGTFGFRVVKTRDDHAKLQRKLRSGDTQAFTVPLHKELAPGTLRTIFRQALPYIPRADLKPWFFDADE
jgi:predicted RNA binding protein YcfA (HicA-like mRNA interferase family)